MQPVELGEVGFHLLGKLAQVTALESLTRCSCSSSRLFVWPSWTFRNSAVPVAWRSRALTFSSM